MDLVIKISDKCNFACEFCSSNMIATSHKDLELSKVTSFLEKHKEVRNIIVNGGDPLCVSPNWYYSLIDWLEKNNRKDISISFTTNLWDFYKHPEKWEDLFKNHISVCTSFQYGKGRKLASGEVFTEDMFVKIFNMFEERIGYKLKFIAVQNSGNTAYTLKTVELAKRLGTTCRINPALRSGRTTTPYPFQLMMISWLKIIEAGLGDYEDNCMLLKKLWNGGQVACPFSMNCQDPETGVKCMSPDGTVHTCPAIADDILVGVDEAYNEDSVKKIPFKDSLLKSECPLCRNYLICNSCKKRIQDIHEMGDIWLEEHCRVMKMLIPRMEEAFKESETENE